MPRESRARARSGGAWRMSDSDWTFLMEEVQVREDVYEYDVSEANRILQLERTEEQWTNVQPCESDGDDNDEDE